MSTENDLIRSEDRVEAHQDMKRRDFLKTMALAGGAVAAAPMVGAATGGSMRDELATARTLPTSDEISKAAYDVDLTVKLAQDYRLTAVDIAQLIDRLPVKPVPW